MCSLYSIYTIAMYGSYSYIVCTMLCVFACKNPAYTIDHKYPLHRKSSAKKMPRRHKIMIINTQHTIAQSRQISTNREESHESRSTTCHG